MPDNQHKIVGVAMIADCDGKTYTLPAPNRHHDILALIDTTVGPPWPITGIQGFVTESGLFLTREDAYLMAICSGQVEETAVDGLLFSEDLW